MSFSPIIRVRRLLEKMRMERSNSSDSPRYQRKSLSHSSYATPAEERFTLLNSVSGQLIFWHGENQFKLLPDETILHIFSFLQPKDLLQTRLVCSNWISYADDPTLWKSLCLVDFNISSPLRSTWKETYAFLGDLFSEGIWEGMSKWVDPAGFDNDQKTTAKLHFRKRTTAGSQKLALTKSTTSNIHRVDSTSNAIDRSELAVSFKDSPYKIHGSGITINCAAPSHFQIEGERIESDSSGTLFKWHKLFEKHTSVYTGKINFSNASVSGQISYHDGMTHWKGIFHYKKISKVKNENNKSHNVMA